jgi:hypothetical protein
MRKLLVLVALAALSLMASCNGNPANCTCVGAGGCSEPDTENADACGVGLICCPVNADGGFEY